MATTYGLQDTEVDHSNVITIGGQEIAIGDNTGTKKALPPGTTRNVFRGYEEVAVPAVDPGKLLKDEKLVEIAQLDTWAQSAFKGYKTLNRIQSRIFEVRTVAHGTVTLTMHRCCDCAGLCTHTVYMLILAGAALVKMSSSSSQGSSMPAMAFLSRQPSLRSVFKQHDFVQVGYRSNQNMLVCAPTGAGKTNIAMIAVLHEVSQHRDATGVLHKDGFKIVYVAPMKALAAEVTRTFGSRLEALGLQVRA